MTGAILTNDEIDALRDVAPGAMPRAAEDIALGRSDRTLRRHSIAIERKLQVFAQAAGVRMTGIMRSPCTSDGKDIDLIGPQVAVEILAALAAVAELRGRAGNLVGFVGLDLHLVDLIIDRTFGAPIASAETMTPTRGAQAAVHKLTALGLKTVQTALSVIVADLAAALGGKQSMDLVTGDATSGGTVELPPALVSLFVWRCELSCGTRGGSFTVLLLPTIADLVERPESLGVNGPPPAWIAQHLQRARVEVSAVLGTCRLTMAELLALRAGDVLRLECGRSDRVPVRVEGIVKFLGQPTQRGGAFAVAIETETT